MKVDTPKGDITVYLTNEQIQRMAAFSLDSLAGIQFHTDANADSYVYGEFVDIDDTNHMKHFTIDPNGSWRDTT